MNGTFYSVAVPVGNTEDITLRAINVLKSVDVIACEDTRTSAFLLDKYGIRTKLLDCHKFNESERGAKIVEMLRNGLSVALISDAGTPGICDPGSIVVKNVLNAGLKAVPIPGASALTAFLSVVPRDSEIFAFVGFLPKTPAKREEIFKRFSTVNTVFYDSPNRLPATLEDIIASRGADTKITVARELTKIYEEFVTDSARNVINYYKEHVLKGEIVAMIHADSPSENPDETELSQKIEKLEKAGFSAKDTSKILSTLFDFPKNKIYALTQKRKNT